jgi:hypothetical protein
MLDEMKKEKKKGDRVRNGKKKRRVERIIVESHQGLH